MQIRVNGEWLDMAQSDIAAHWGNMRFTDVFADDYTTDFELPMTAKNMRLLDVWSVTSRVGEPFGDMVNCWVMMRGMGKDALLSVNGISGGAIQVTIYIANFPASLRGVVNRLLVDNDDTIVDLTQRTLETTETTHAGVNYTSYLTSYDVIHPNIKVNYILQRIATATGITMPTVDDELRLIATRSVVCPQVTKQALLISMAGSDRHYTQYGQHITNEVDADNVAVKMRKSATVRFTFYARSGLNATANRLYLQRSTDGETWVNVGEINKGAQDTVLTTVINTGFASGVYWRVYSDLWVGRVFVVAEWLDYTITDDDYNVTLNYDDTADYSIPTWVDTEISYVYFGTMANLESFTVRELLSSLAWYLNRRLVIDINYIGFTDADTSTEIDAELTAYHFDSDHLGRSTKIESANGETLAEVAIDNSKLADSVTLHKSIFSKLQSQSLLGGVVLLNLYQKTDGKLSPISFSGSALAVAQEVGGMVALYPADGWAMLGIDTLVRVCEVDGMTREDISRYDYVVIDGHRYMLIDGDIDDNSGYTTFKALLA